MYEEEDDDLPSQYRRLQAHIASTADIFNGRLNAYLLSAVGTRSMVLDQNMGQIGQPQSTPFFPYTPPQAATPQVTSPTTTITQKGQNYRPAPYPSQQSRMNAQQQRSGSLSSIHDVKKEAQTLEGQSSVPSTPQQSSTPIGAATPQGMNPGTLLSPQFNFGYGFAPGMSTFDPMMQFNNNASPLTAALPNEAQQFFGNNFFDPSNAYTNYFMNGPTGLMMPQQGVNYNYNPNLTSSKNGQNSQPMNGMNQTLSQMPTSMDSGMDQSYSSQTASASDTSTPYSNPTYAFPNYFSDAKSGDGTTTLEIPTNEYDSFVNYNQDE